MTRFEAIGNNLRSQSVKFEVWANQKRIFQSEQSGIVHMDVNLPKETTTIDLKVDPCDNYDYDHSLWCYPRLYRQ